jgi:hypothetical protein
VDNTSLPPVASKIVAGVISVFLHARRCLASSEMICVGKSGMVSDKAKKDASAIFVAPYARSASQDQRLGLQIELKESKTPGGENISTHQALIFLSLDVIRQAS